MGPTGQSVGTIVSEVNVSRVGRMPIEIPDGVDVKIEDNTVTVKGPLGQLAADVVPDMAVLLNDGVITVTRPSDEKKHRAFHGLTRAVIANMVEGVSKGYEKTLEIEGVGYRAEKPQGNKFTLQLGYSHPVIYDIPEGLSVEVPSPTVIVVKGIDKQAVGQAAAEIRGFRPPEPYKGKGVRYKGEWIRRKAGKAG